MSSQGKVILSLNIKMVYIESSGYNILSEITKVSGKEIDKKKENTFLIMINLETNSKLLLIINRKKMITYHDLAQLITNVKNLSNFLYLVIK